jgi:hypothetical protein
VGYTRKDAGPLLRVSPRRVAVKSCGSEREVGCWGRKPATLSKMPDSCVRRKTGTATNSRLWNWLAVPGLPTADTPPVARPIIIPSDEASPHNATDTSFRRSLPEIGVSPRVCPMGVTQPLREDLSAFGRLPDSAWYARNGPENVAGGLSFWSRRVRRSRVYRPVSPPQKLTA